MKTDSCLTLLVSPKRLSLAANARKYGHKTISAPASEGTLDRQYLYELLDLVEQSEFVYILETNGMTLGDDQAFTQSLAKYKNLHVRVVSRQHQLD